MNKKIVLGSIAAVIMLMTISFATAVTTQNTQTRESPLYKIRTKLAIGERIQNLKANIKARFVGVVGDRLLFVPLLNRLSYEDDESFSVAITLFTCPWMCCKV